MKDKIKKGEDLLFSINKASLSRNAENHPAIDFLLSKTGPLNLNVSAGFPLRVNVLIGIIDFKYFFGGYISVFNFAKRLFREGYNVRMIIMDQCAFDPYLWRQKIKNYEGLEDFFDYAEVVYAYDRAEIIECNPKDAFVATSWWTAYIANEALGHVDAKRFVYFTQEYEPIFYYLGSLYALAKTSYDLPHYALFSTELLRDFHRCSKIGLFKDGSAIGDQYSIAFSNAIVKVAPDESSITNRKTKRLLFYARPEDHAARNLFELGILALSKAVKNRAFDAGEWEFYGIGTLNKFDILLDAGRNVRMRLLPKVSLNDYKELLPQFDVGMSLMLSPHPSLVPLEMVSAGMIVVTNTHANKTSECLRKISTNFIAAEPTIDAIAQSLGIAAKRVYDYQDRIRGAAVNWPQSWEDAFNDDFMDRVKGFINQVIDRNIQQSLLLKKKHRKNLERILHVKWKFLIFFYKLRDLLLPRNSWRRRFAKRIINNIKTFKINFSAKNNGR